MKGRRGEDEGSSVEKKLSDPLPFHSLPSLTRFLAKQRKRK